MFNTFKVVGPEENLSQGEARNMGMYVSKSIISRNLWFKEHMMKPDDGAFGPRRKPCMLNDSFQMVLEGWVLLITNRLVSKQMLMHSFPGGYDRLSLHQDVPIKLYICQLTSNICRVVIMCPFLAQAYRSVHIRDILQLFSLIPPTVYCSMFSEGLLLQ